LYPVAAFVIAQPVKLAVPEATGAVRPPLQLSVPGPGFVAIESVTVPVLLSATRLPFASSTATEIGKVPVPVAWMFALAAGCVENASWAAGPYGVTLNVGVVVAEVTSVVQELFEYSLAVIVKIPPAVAARTEAPDRLAVLPATRTQLLAGGVKLAPLGSPDAASAT
jgi:hypothetical protein